jgi:hypothetical protein
MTLATNTLEKQPSETRLMTMDFSSSMSTGEIISSLDTTETSPAGVTFGTVTLGTKSVSVLISGGVDKKKYKIRFIVTTSLDQILEHEGYLYIKEL